MADLIIADIPILQDPKGRYSLNRLHQASGGAESKRPSDWLRRKSTQALIEELAKQVVDLPCDVVTGGNNAGTYVHELLAVSYAGWISPAFQLRVNQAFLTQNRTQPVIDYVPPSRTDELAYLREHIAFLTQLGMCEQRDKLMLADMARNLLTTGALLPAVAPSDQLTPSMPFFVADRVRALGYVFTRKEEARFMPALGKHIKAEYRQRYGADPQQSQRFVDGAVRLVNVYSVQDAEWIDALIQTLFVSIGITRTVTP